MSQIELFPTGAFGIADPARLGALGALVITALITLLQVFRRRGYILRWVLGWSLLTAALTLWAGEPIGPPFGLVILGVTRFLALAGIVVIALSAPTFHEEARWGRRHLPWLVPPLVWCLVAPLVLPPGRALAPAYLVGAGVLLWGGVSYLGVLRRAELLGAGVTGVALLLTAGTQTWIGIVVTRAPAPTVPAELMVANGLLFLFAAFGMHLLVFEEMTFELRVANRRLQQTQTELREQAITDALTGCHNRRFFDEVIGRELERRRRYDVPLSILFVDIDRFKMVNDSLGHEAGDRLLQYVALFLRRNVREADYVFRWGGDEFVLLLSCGIDEAREKGTRLARSFRTALATSALPAEVGLSVGCSSVAADDDDIMTRIHEADEAMYRHKLETEIALRRDDGR